MVVGVGRSCRMLLLGGTTEANAVAAALADDGGIDVTVSLAGRTRRPHVPHGRLRVGGFGGTDGLERYLQDEAIDVVVDALHPFAAVMPFHAAAACAASSTPLLQLRRPPWAAMAGDRWVEVADLDAAAAALRDLGARRVLLTTGRQELAPFRTLHGAHVVVRSIEPPDLDGFADAVSVADRGPFTVDGELGLLRDRRIDALVSKNSGGASTAAKLEAARRLGVVVVMVRRPPLPDAPRSTTVAEAVAWVRARAEAVRGTSGG
jgi:precorrin-6A/cobalt-precorrin-6A reductase